MTHNVKIFQSAEQNIVHFFPFFAVVFFFGLAFFLRPRSTQQVTSCEVNLILHLQQYNHQQRIYNMKWLSVRLPEQ